MSTYQNHEENLEPAFQIVLEVARRRAKREASHNSSLVLRAYDLAAQQLASLESCTAELEAKLQHLLVSRRRALNALLPIHRIPSEILNEIIATSLALWLKDDCETYQEHLYTLRRVSTTWRALIDNSAFLWATVSSSEHLDATKNALIKSKEAPLDVIYHTRRIRRSKMVEFLALVLPHVHRWRTLDVFDLNGSEAEELLEFLAGCNAPKLQELSLVDTGGFRGMIDPFEGQSAHLRRIKLNRSLLVPWDSAMLSNLHILHISNLDWEAPSMDQVISILRASPALIELTLQRFSREGNNAHPIKQIHPVKLLSLKTLTIGHLSPELTALIVENVQIPNCENIVIHMDASAKASCATNESFVHSARAIAEASDSADVEFGAGLFDLICWKENKVVLRVCIEGEGWEFNTAENLLHLLDSSLGLDVIINTKLREKSDLRKILNLLPSLRGARALRLGQHRPFTHDGSNALIRELGVTTRVDGILRWPLPHLETLRLKSPSLEMEALLGVLRARLKAKGEPPHRLKSLDLVVRNRNRYYDELERIFGQRVVGYYEPESGSDSDSDSDMDRLTEGESDGGDEDEEQDEGEGEDEEEEEEEEDRYIDGDDVGEKEGDDEDELDMDSYFQGDEEGEGEGEGEREGEGESDMDRFFQGEAETQSQSQSQSQSQDVYDV